MRFGIIGAGNIGQAVARHAVAAGHEVIISNRRGGEPLAAAADAVGATPGSVTEAAAGELVLLAVPWTAVPAALDGLTWGGQVLIDATNAFISFSPMQVEDFGDGSSSERVASLAPGAHVVKAFNTLYARMIAATRFTPRAGSSSSTRATTRARRRASPRSWRHSGSRPSTSALCTRAGGCSRSAAVRSRASTRSSRTSDSPRRAALVAMMARCFRGGQNLDYWDGEL